MSTATSPLLGGDHALQAVLNDPGDPCGLARTIPARKLPTLRDRRVKLFQPAAELAEAAQKGGPLSQEHRDLADSWDVQDQTMQNLTLRRAAMFYGTPEFCRLLAGAYPGLSLEGDWVAPRQPRVDHPNVSKLDGMIYLAEPIRMEHPDGPEAEDAKAIPVLSARLLEWMVLPDMEPGREGCGYLTFWAVGLTPDGREAVSRDLAVVQPPKDGEETITWRGHPSKEAARLVLAAWALLDQETLTESTTRAPEPAQSRKRSRARRERDSAPVTVVDLRHASRARQAAVEGAATSPRHSRWIVSGHWREQACGKGRADRRRIYIEPHYKGPADAPLIVRERVFQW